VQTASLGDLSPVYISPTITSITEGGVAGYRIDIKGIIPFSGTDFNFTIVGYVFEGSAELDGLTVYPAQFKFDIGIDGFPFDSLDNKLALEMILETEFEVSQEIDDEEFIIDSGGASGYFGWLDTALVDGVNTPVSEYTRNVDGDDFVYLCYEAGDSILHDPILGLYYQPKKIPGFPLIAIAGFVTLGIFVVITRKFKKNR
jgi:hypothetical protein